MTAVEMSSESSGQAPSKIAALLGYPEQRHLSHDPQLQQFVVIMWILRFSVTLFFISWKGFELFEAYLRPLWINAIEITSTYW